jgi:hypothetical protein
LQAACLQLCKMCEVLRMLVGIAPNSTTLRLAKPVNSNTR